MSSGFWRLVQRTTWVDGTGTVRTTTNSTLHAGVNGLLGVITEVEVQVRGDVCFQNRLLAVCVALCDLGFCVPCTSQRPGACPPGNTHTSLSPALCVPQPLCLCLCVYVCLL